MRRKQKDKDTTANWIKRFNDEFLLYHSSVGYINHFCGKENLPERIKIFIKKLLKANDKKWVKKLGKIKLECETVICDCGDEWKDSDMMGLINECLNEIKEQ